MYYILTANKLERTAPCQAKLPGRRNGGDPIEYLKEVIIEDSLGICEELEARMQYFVNTYHDKWAEVVGDPTRRAKFQQFVNTDVTQSGKEIIEFVEERRKRRPADWPTNGAAQTNWRPEGAEVFACSAKVWVAVGKASNFSPNVGSMIL